MEETLAVACVGFVGVVVAAVVGFLARPRIDRLNGRGNNPGTNREVLYPAAQGAVNEVRRDLRDVNKEMCVFHSRLETAIVSQASATADLVSLSEKHTYLLEDINKTLERIEAQG